jgi:hypothetical protein
MQSSRIQCILLLLGFFLAPGALRLHGAGSGLNVVVVVNARSEASVRLGNYYAERRGIPPQNVLRMEHPLEEGVVNWSHATLQSRLLQPLDAMIAARNLQDQALFVVLSMDIPYRTTRIDGTNSTTSVLYYGFKPDDPHLPGTCTLSSQSTNAYFASESRFRDRPPASSRTPYLAAMITGATLEEATMLVDQGVAGDATFPGQVVLLIKTSDPARNIRHRQFDHAIFNSRLLGRPNLLRAESNGIFTPGGAIFGAHTGWPIVEMPAGFFLPGSRADHRPRFCSRRSGRQLRDGGRAVQLRSKIPGHPGLFLPGTRIQPRRVVLPLPSKPLSGAPAWRAPLGPLCSKCAGGMVHAGGSGFIRHRPPGTPPSANRAADPRGPD